MNFLIDIGNTRVKWAYCDAGQLTETKALAHEAFFQWLDEPTTVAVRPERVVVACVGREALRERLRQYCERAWALNCELITTRAQGSGVVNGYQEPQRLGIDRWLALCGARARTRDACLVIDAGSALTVDLLTADGEHQGGLIVPGLQMGMMSLLAGTGKVRFRESDSRLPGAGDLLGRDTESAVQYGVLWSATSLIERVRAKEEARLGRPLRCLLTGGDAPLLQNYLAGQYQWAPALVLEGLAIEAGLRIST